MPSIVRSRQWFIRVTTSWMLIEAKCKDVLQWIDLVSVLCIGHVGTKTEKEHAHMLLTLSSDLQKQSLDTRIKNLFGVKGADYSCVPWDGADAAGGYMFHDKEYQMFANRGFDSDTIQRYVDLNEKTQKVIAINKEKGANRNVEAVLAIFKGLSPSKYDVAKAFLQRVRKGEMYEMGDFKLKAMVEEVLIKLCESDQEFDQYCTVRMNNLWR